MRNKLWETNAYEKQTVLQENITFVTQPSPNLNNVTYEVAGFKKKEKS